MSKFPSLFLSHGAPSLILEDVPARHFLEQIGQQLPTPSAILVASAHWEARGPKVSAAMAPKTIYDFSGFPAELYAMTYPAPGAPALAGKAVQLLQEAGCPAVIDEQRGLDHGAWAPLKLMYPAASIPVASLSLLPDGGPAAHLAIGEALRPLREDGVLIVGSGSLTHSLRDVFAHPLGAPTPSWVSAFQDWTADAIAQDKRDDLLAYRRLAPSATRNHPSEEHFLPLFVALGAGTPGHPGRRLHGSIDLGVLAMDAYAFD
ncbi:MAG TPA: class III extradiol ring-cleavage dioxygenase [Telmatospirillum sp.]|nr:class III extradiol ring-cleavage dioxygenase [Telmatospirillum sp.]